MIVRCFEGRSMPEVIEQVRREMGEDAVILHTQQKRGFLGWLRRASSVRVWAAIPSKPKLVTDNSTAQFTLERVTGTNSKENPELPFSPNLQISEPVNGKDVKVAKTTGVEPRVKEHEFANPQKGKKRKKRNEVTEKVEEETQKRHRRTNSRKAKQTNNGFNEIAIRVERQLQLLAASLWGKEMAVTQTGVIGLLWQCGIDLAAIQHIFTSTTPIPDPNIPTEKWLKSTLQRCLPVTGGLAPTTDVAVLVGPTGVGKTTTVAKIAANQLMQQRKRVALVTVDVFRIGAVQQLETYARLMGLPFFVATTPEEAQKCIYQAKQVAELALVDTIGRSPKHKEQLASLWELVAAMNPDEILLTLPANGNPCDLFLAADQFSIFCPTSLVITKLDEATQTGVIVNLVTRLNLPVSYITTGQNVPEDLEVPTSERLAEWVLLPIAEKCEICEVKGVTDNA